MKSLEETSRTSKKKDSLGTRKKVLDLLIS
jgi:hypothetical protein